MSTLPWRLRDPPLHIGIRSHGPRAEFTFSRMWYSSAHTLTSTLGPHWGGGELEMKPLTQHMGHMAIRARRWQQPLPGIQATGAHDRRTAGSPQISAASRKLIVGGGIRRRRGARARRSRGRAGIVGFTAKLSLGCDALPRHGSREVGFPAEGGVFSQRV